MENIKIRIQDFFAPITWWIHHIFRAISYPVRVWNYRRHMFTKEEKAAIDGILQNLCDIGPGTSPKARREKWDGHQYKRQADMRHELRQEHGIFFKGEGFTWDGNAGLRIFSADGHLWICRECDYKNRSYVIGLPAYWECQSVKACWRMLYAQRWIWD